MDNTSPSTSQPEITKPPSESIRLEVPQVKPTVTYTILAVTIIAFILQYISKAIFGGDLLFAIGGKINQYIKAGELWRLITPVLLHGSILHIVFNMYALFAIGSSLERFFGHTRYLTLYLVGGFAGNVLSYYFSPNPSLGSSTAVFGLLAAEGVFAYQNRKFFGDRARTIIINTVSVAVVNFLIGLSGQGIDNWGHLGGLFGGLIFTWMAGPSWQVEGLYPALKVSDERSRTQVWLAALTVLVIFGAFVVFRMFQ